MTHIERSMLYLALAVAFDGEAHQIGGFGHVLNRSLVALFLIGSIAALLTAAVTWTLEQRRAR